MKIAIATEDGKAIHSHFSRSPYFVIYEIEDGISTKKYLRKNTFTGHFRRGSIENGRHLSDKHHDQGKGESHKHHSVALGLKDCQVVVSKGMGRKAWEDLRAKGIEMIVTNETNVVKAIELYLEGELTDRVEKLHQHGNEDNQ